MAPFNMRCVTCGEYIYKGKKFNARKEDVENQDYLGIRIYRFYIKCTRCLQEISFKTDPKNTDYEIEAGATRNFMALKLAEEQAKREEDELKEEEANNPMKLLENRTEQSRNEIELLESLEELRDLNRRHQNIDYEQMLQQFDPSESIREREERLAKQDEDYIKTIKFGAPGHKRVASEEIVEEVVDNSPEKPKIVQTVIKPPPEKITKTFSIGVMKKSSMMNLVKKKTPETATKPAPVVVAPTVPTGNGSLGLLGAYSDSESSENGD
jgi:Saf4/Yju2 protein